MGCTGKTLTFGLKWALSHWLNRSSVMPVRKIVCTMPCSTCNDMPYAAMKFIIETIDDLSEAWIWTSASKKNGEKLIALLKEYAY